MLTTNWLRVRCLDHNSLNEKTVFVGFRAPFFEREKRKRDKRKGEKAAFTYFLLENNKIAFRPHSLKLRTKRQAFERANALR